MEEGGEFELVKHFSVGGSGYEIVPFGNQKIFSKIVGKGQSGKGKGKNSFDQSAVSSGSGLTRENGFNSWVAFDPTPLWRVQLGFTRSVTYQPEQLWLQLADEPGQSGPPARLLARSGARNVISIFQDLARRNLRRDQGLPGDDKSLLQRILS